MAAGSGETARPASGKYVFGAHRPAAWQLTISLGKFLISSREAARQLQPRAALCLGERRLAR
jgi:hypothetical protein